MKSPKNDLNPTISVRMIRHVLICLLVSTSITHGQWKSETYNLKGGWNAIYLHGDATYDSIENLLPPNVLEVWRWNPNPEPVQFTISPLIPSGGTAVWSVWKRGGSANDLSQLTGQAAYLVKCAGPARASAGISGGQVTSVTVTDAGSGYTAAPAVTLSAPATGITATATATISGGAITAITITNAGSGYSAAPTVTVAAPSPLPSSSVTLTQSPVPPRAQWVRNGANLLGFPSAKTGSAYPAFSQYFATFPAAIATNVKIFKYAGGELGATNPVQVFSTSVEQVNRTQAYWFDSELVGSFTAPVDISLNASSGLDFGRSLNSVIVRVTNRSSVTSTVTFTPVDSDSPPTGASPIQGHVPLTLRTYDGGTLSWVETPITAAFSQVIGPASSVELVFGINRADAVMSGASSGAAFASLLRLTDSSNLFDIFLPVRATKDSTAGLWVGDAQITNVSSQVSNSAKGVATLSNGGIASVAVEGTGGFGYTGSPQVSISAPPSGGSQAVAVATVKNGSVTGFTVLSRGSGYEKTPTVSVSPPPPLAGTSTPRPYSLRMLLHVDDSGTPRLLSQAFMGALASDQQPGVCTREALLDSSLKAVARRLVAAHMPLDRTIVGTGSVTVPGTLTHEIIIPFNDPTNPFVHQYHPDHDNLDARFRPLTAGVESHDITRTCTFYFTDTPPPGVPSTPGWGSSVLGGVYSETLTGLHKNPLQVSGTFQLHRASEIGTLTE